MEQTLLFSVVIYLALPFITSAERVCCPGYPECFTDDSPYDHLPLPDCQDVVQATFTLFTGRNPTQGVTIRTDLPLPFVYDGSKRTAFIIHGWMSSTEKQWVPDIRNGLLFKEDINVIQVDWSNGAGYVWYPQAASNIRSTGSMVGQVANMLIDEGGARSSDLWCIGASLGAHTCGQAGRYVTFGRVTGLDPAGPLFENYDIKTGLNPGAGEYVEALHSAGKGGLVGVNPGTLKPLGHVDFYPNGGAVQPGCINYHNEESMEVIPEHYNSAEKVGNIRSPQYTDLFTAEAAMVLSEVTPYLACSHNRATQYFIESMSGDGCNFFAYEECTDYKNIPGSCTSCGLVPCNELGYGSYRSADHQGKRGLMYLETNDGSPFCRG